MKYDNIPLWIVLVLCLASLIFGAYIQSISFKIPMPENCDWLINHINEWKKTYNNEHKEKQKIMNEKLSIEKKYNECCESYYQRRERMNITMFNEGKWSCSWSR